MKAIEISQKTHLVRHWFKWYIVQRGATDWRPLEIKQRFDLEKTSKALNGKGSTHPPIDLTE